MARNLMEGALISDGGTAAKHGEAPIPYVVAPTDKEAYSTLRPRLRPSACWRIDDLRFDFDSSFLLPAGTHEFQLLARQRPPGPDDTGKALLLSVFGHADPSGQDEYNKVLAGRRATSVYGLLTRDVALWEKLYSSPHGGDKWGTRQIQMMLTQLGYLQAAPTGYLDNPTTKAVKAFQQDNGLPGTGFPDGGTRAKLFLAYMDALCVDEQGVPFQYVPEDFLSRGPSAGGKCAYQGCGEFNPVRVFSEQAAAEYQKPARKAERDAANMPNRRVVIYMFDPALNITPEQWPCPTVSEGPAGCKAKFWPDGEARRNPRGAQREHLTGGRTFACAFYDRLARGSPCEGVRETVSLYLMDHHGRRMGANPESDDPVERESGAPYRLTVGSQVREGRASAEGLLIEQNVYAGGACELEWGAYPTSEHVQGKASAPGTEEPRYLYSRVIYLGTEEQETPDTERQLHNLGYTSKDPEENRQHFLADHPEAEGEPFAQAVDRVHREGLEAQEA
ncbi:peptidoglycan-binding protein [Hyalangium minutum]|nr:peptidoglycan-binding protein [Hyalangium minutum]